MATAATTSKRKKPLSSITGLQARSGSYFFAKMIDGIRIHEVLGRLEETEIEAAEQQARELIKSVRENGQIALERFRSEPAQLRLGHNKQSVKDGYRITTSIFLCKKLHRLYYPRLGPIS